MDLATLIIPAVFLLWFAATVVQAVAGLRRCRWRTPGGRLALAGAVCGLAFPAMLLVLAAEKLTRVAAVTRLMDRYTTENVVLAFWLASCGLGLAAAARALRRPGEAAAAPAQAAGREGEP